MTGGTGCVRGVSLWEEPGGAVGTGSAMLLEIHARDPQSTSAFYAEVLGFVDLRSGEVELRVVPCEAPPRREHYLVVAVPDVAATVAAARERDLEVLREWSEGGRRLALIADPDGNLVELHPE